MKLAFSGQRPEGTDEDCSPTGSQGTQQSTVLEKRKNFKVKTLKS